MRILVVDDEEIFAYLVARHLINRGHIVDLALNGEQAIGMVRVKEYDAVITDYHMPGMNGGELYHALVAEDASFADRVIFMSGDPSGSGLAGWASTNGKRYITKLFLLESVDDALELLPEPRGC